MAAPPRTAPARPRLPVPRRPPAPPAAEPAGRWWIAVLAGCTALAVLSLQWPSEPTYDPMSWVIWGREIAHGSLDTVTGPSWKPLPVLFTAPFALTGDDLAPQLWLVVARAGALLGIVMGFRLAARLAGPLAGAFAALAIAASEGYAYNAWRGNSEGLLVGLSLWAVERHFDGRRTSAFALGVAAALLRPEVWPFVGLYGLWVAWADPRRRALVGGAFAAIGVLWFVPEYIGSGDFLRAANRALEPNLDSAAFADFPALEVLRQSLATVPAVVGAGALLAVVLLRRERVVSALAAAAGALLLAVAVMTQAGFSGNLRYVVLPMALVGVLGGAGWVAAAKAVPGRVAALAVAAVACAGIAHAAGGVREDADAQVLAVQREVLGIEDLRNVIARAGGPAAITGCGQVFTNRFEVPIVAWELDLRLQDVDIFPVTPGVTLAMRHSALSRDPRFRHSARTARWVVGKACA